MIYLCGPMSGLPDFNRPSFNQAAAELRSLGYEVHNPAEVKLPDGVPETWENYMREAITALAKCDTLVYLPETSQSRGARIEYRLAGDLGFDTFYFDCFIKLAKNSQK